MGKRLAAVLAIASLACAFGMGGVAYAVDGGDYDLGVASTGHTVMVKVGSNAEYTLKVGDAGYTYGAGISTGAIDDDTLLLQTALWTANDFGNIAKGDKVSITLQRGATYEIDGILPIFSHTDLNLNGATIKRSDGSPNTTMLMNFPIGYKSNSAVAYTPEEWAKVTSQSEIDSSDKEVRRESAVAGGYNMSTDIAVYGGTVDGGNVKQATTNSDLIRFDHASGITVKDVTLRNVYDCHHLEFIGVKDGLVSNCGFSGFEYRNHKVVKANALEALELDSAWTDKPGAAGTDPVSWPETGRWAKMSYLDGTHDENCVIEGCTFTDLPTALGEHHVSTDARCTNSTGIVIRNNTIKATASLAYKPGMTIGGFDNVEVLGNTISGPYNFMIQVYGGMNIKIDGNTLTGGAKNAIMIDTNSDKMEAKKVTVSNNTVKSAGGHGISVSGADASSIAGNTITSPAQNGINVNSGSVATISGNAITSSGNNGISVLGGTVGEIGGNTVSKAKKNSVNIGKNAASGSPVVSAIMGNTLKDSKGHGIALIYGTTKSVKNNTVSKTGKSGTGITMTAGKVNAISGNKVINAGKNGISFNGGTIGEKGKSSTGILSNTIKKCGATGIAVAKKGTVANINKNKITNPGKNGITYSGKVKVYNVNLNTISKKSGRFGIWMGGTSVNTTVQKNKITVNRKEFALGHASGAKYKTKGNKVKVK